MNFNLCVEDRCWSLNIRLLLVMKLAILLTMLVIAEATASSMAQTVTLKAERVSLLTAMRSIQQQTGLLFLLKGKELADTEVDVEVENVKMQQAMDALLDGTSFYWILKNKTIVIAKRSSQTKVVSKTQSKVITTLQTSIRGVVRDESGAPLEGVTVAIQGTTTATTTTNRGEYQLEASNRDDVLVFTAIGFKPQEVILNGQTAVDIILESVVSDLDEVVVVGYGMQRKSEVAGSVASLKSEDLTIAPVASTTNALVGRLPGLISKQSSGMPGADGADLSIRGFGHALVIVDGVQTSFNEIDASQIESISILKDGAASIYGARAGNGVILVTTKRGRNQVPSITLDAAYTLQGVTNMLKPTNSGQRAQMERETHLNSGKPESSAPWTEEAVQKFFAGDDPAYPDQDWYGYVFRDWAPQQNHNISMRGGNEKTKYYGYMGYVNQETMVKRNGGDYTRYNIQSNVEATVSTNLTMSIDLRLVYKDRLFPIRGLGNNGYLWQDYYNTRPWFPAELPDGSKIAWGGIDVGSVATVSNINLMGYSRDKAKNFVGTVSLVYDIRGIDGLKAKAFVNYSDDDSFSKYFRKPISFYTYNPNSDIYSLAGSFNESNLSETVYKGGMLTQQYSLNYDRTLGVSHRFNAMALIEAIDIQTNSLSAFRSDFLTPSIDQLFAGSALGMSNNGTATEMGRYSYVGRLNYSLLDRYYADLIFRADASAKFPPASRWGYFPSISLGWALSKETFLKNIQSLDNLKIRVSYGESGDDAVGDFQYLAGYSFRGSAILDDQIAQSIFPTGLANPLLTWEKMTIYNAGIDFSLFNGVLYGTGDIFNRKRQGIPATRVTSLPSTFGASLPPENLNALNTRGFDLSIGSAFKSGVLLFDINGNITWNISKWIYFEEPAFEDPDQKRIYGRTGQRVDRAIGYVSDGLFTSQEEINALSYTYADLGGNETLRPGDVKYKDINGDDVFDWRDQTEIGNGTTPRWLYGLNTNLKYRNFDFSLLFQGAFGYNTWVALTQYSNAKLYELRWTEENNDPGALVARPGGAGTNSLTSDYTYKPTSYLRLKTLSVGYQLPSQFIKKAGLNNLRVYFAGINLLTFSTLSDYGVDPEIPSGTITVYPQQRTLSFGLSMSL